MLRLVSDFLKSAVKELMMGLAGVAWIVLLCFAVMTSAKAQTTFSGAVGVDHWAVHGGPARYLPDYSPKKPWNETAVWARGQVQHSTDTDYGPVTLTAQGQTHQVHGNRIDRLDADWRFGQATGVRVGVLPYRLTWCRTHDGRNAWISEPDAFCRFAGLNEVAQGAFGAQVYHSTIARGWLVDGMAGVYRPLIDGQNDKLGPFVSVGPTVKHTASGASINALHLATGVQSRAGILRTEQLQDSDSGSYQRRMHYDSYYLAAEGNVTRTVDVRASLAGYLGKQVNPALPFKWDGRSLTLETVYRPAPGHTLAAGWSRYSNKTTYATPPNGQYVQVDSTSLAWRFALPNKFWGVVQWTQTDDDATTRRGVQTVRDGRAIGLRVARDF